MNNLEDQLGKTITSPSTDNAMQAMSSLVTDLIEIDIDTLIGNELIKELPVVKVFVTASKVIKGISNELLLKKIFIFLFQLKGTTLKEREKFLQKLGSSKRKEILSNLILVLDKHEQLRKSEIQGKLFAAYIKEKMNYMDYMTLTYVVNMMDINTLEALVKFYTIKSSASLKPELIYNFIFLQLIRIDNSKIGTLGGGGPEYKRNRLGMLLVEHGAEAKIPQDYKKLILKQT
ncbi:hypothetical protein ISS85_05095 [Candidatus Microgenomates bacterium]|nr:hypothetical protein [Candidatus Microgenomates bacterium]